MDATQHALLKEYLDLDGVRQELQNSLAALSLAEARLSNKMSSIALDITPDTWCEWRQDPEIYYP